MEKAKVANKQTAESIVETTPAWLRKREAIEREFPNLNRTQITRILAIVFDDFQRQLDEIRARKKQKLAEPTPQNIESKPIASHRSK